MTDLGSPDFSVVIPTFGRPGFLREALDSVLSQAGREIEVLVVDDASAEPVSLPRDPRVRLVRRDANGGPAAARNTGVAAAVGRWLCFLDDDDLWTDSRLEWAKQGLHRAAVTVCWSRYLDEAPAPKRVLEGRVHDTILDGMTPHLGATTLERRLFVPFDERYRGTEDVEWWLRMSAATPLSTVREFGCLIRRHDGPRATHGADARIEGGRLLLEEHHTYFGSHPRAAAFRLQRIALTATASGDRRTARHALARAFRARPSLRTCWHLLRTVYS